MEDGTRVWFTSNTRFNGPVHSNGELSFAYTPTFLDEVSSYSTTAWFYNNGNNKRLSADSNPPYDTPIFAKGFKRGATYINMPTVTYTQVAATLGMPNANIQNDNQMYQTIRSALGLPSGTTPPPNGIYTQTILNGGGIFVQGDASINFGIDSQGRAVYTITQGSTTYVFTIDRANNRTYVNTGTNTITINAIPNGMIYVNGNITGISGLIQKDEQLTVTANGSITITNDIIYQEISDQSYYNTYTSLTQTLTQQGRYYSSVSYNPNAQNVLGLLARSGNIIINPPQNVGNNIKYTHPFITAVLMAPSGVVKVQDYNTRPEAGQVHLLGGIISNRYGAFGTFSGTSNSTGFGRDFYYDYRMRSGFSPPYFPTTGRTMLQEGTVNNPKWLNVEKWEEKWE